MTDPRTRPLPWSRSSPPAIRLRVCSRIPAIAARDIRCATECRRPRAIGSSRRTRISPVLWKKWTSCWARWRSEKAAAAIGSRALDRSLVGVHQAALREASGRVFNLVMRAATGLPFRDTQCGFKLFRKDAARVIFPRQRLDGFGFDVEDLLIARIHGFKVVEVPVRWDNVEGTKVSALTGARAFWDLAVVRWHQLCGRYR